MGRDGGAAGCVSTSTSATFRRSRRVGAIVNPATSLDSVIVCSFFACLDQKLFLGRHRPVFTTPRVLNASNTGRTTKPT
jgi:hypothetical protein